MGSDKRYVGVLLAMVLALALGWVASADAYVYRGNAGGTGHVYWGCYSGGYCPIGRANLDGSAVKPSFITGSNYVYGVAVDGAHVYWGNGGGTTAIGRANLDGSAANQSFIKGEPNYPRGLAVDGAHIYWANYNTGTIGRANLDGSGVNQRFITSLGYPVDVAVDGAHIYWATGSAGGTPQYPQQPGRIGRANLDGSAVNPAFITATLPSVSSIRDQGGPWGLAVDGAHIYWDNGDFGYIYGRPTKYAIGRANLDGSGTNLSFIANAGANRPQGVAVDRAHIYWASPASPSTIARANLDGSGVNLSFIASVSAGALAVDATTTTTTGASPVGLWRAGSRLYRWVAIDNGFEERSMTPHKLKAGCLVRLGDPVDRYYSRGNGLYRVAYQYWRARAGGPGKKGLNCTHSWKAPEATVKIIVSKNRMTLSCDDKPGQVCYRYTRVGS